MIFRIKEDLLFLCRIIGNKGDAAIQTVTLTLLNKCYFSTRKDLKGNSTILSVEAEKRWFIKPRFLSSNHYSARSLLTSNRIMTVCYENFNIQEVRVAAPQRQILMSAQGILTSIPSVMIKNCSIMAEKLKKSFQLNRDPASLLLLRKRQAALVLSRWGEQSSLRLLSLSPLKC